MRIRRTLGRPVGQAHVQRAVGRGGNLDLCIASGRIQQLCQWGRSAGTVDLQRRIDVLLGLVGLQGIGAGDFSLEPDPIFVGCLVEGMVLGSAGGGNGLGRATGIIGFILVGAGTVSGVFDMQAAHYWRARPDGVGGEVDFPAQVRARCTEAIRYPRLHRLPVLPPVVGKIEDQSPRVQVEIGRQVGLGYVAIYCIQGFGLGKACRQREGIADHHRGGPARGAVRLELVERHIHRIAWPQLSGNQDGTVRRGG